MSGIGVQVDQLFERYPSAIGRELLLNMKLVLTEGALTPDYAAPALLAVAELTGDRAIADVAGDWMAALGFSAEQVREAREAPAMVTLLDTYQDFRARVADPSGYGAIGLWTTSLTGTALGAARFERLAFVVSVANGGGAGIATSERRARDAGVTTLELHDLARLAAVVKAASKLP